MANNADAHGSEASNARSGKPPSLLGAEGSQQTANAASISILGAVDSQAGNPNREQPRRAIGWPVAALISAGVLIAIGAIFYEWNSTPNASGVVADAQVASEASLSPVPQTASEASTAQTAVVEDDHALAEVSGSVAAAPSEAAASLPSSSGGAPDSAGAQPGHGARSGQLESERANPARSGVLEANATDVKPVAGSGGPQIIKSPGGRASNGKSKTKPGEDRLLAALNRSAGDKPAAAQNEIDLIRALLENSDGTAPSSNKRAAQKAAPAKARTRAEAQTATAVASTNHDVVERKAGTSTADLIRRCEQTGLLEGLLCRIRICADHWGEDPACPAQAQSPGAP